MNALLSSAPVQPPRAEAQPRSRDVHGHTLNDPYGWLRSADWQGVMRDPSKLEPEIRSYLEAENNYTSAILKPTEALQDTLFKEYRGRIREDDSTVPADEGPWSYYARYVVGGQHPVFCRRMRGGVGSETILFDGDAEAEGKAYFQVAACEPSPSHQRIGVAVDESGAELWSLRFKDVEQGTWLDDLIEGTSGSFVFIDDNSVLYTVLDAEHRPRAVMLHHIGQAPETDTVVYHEDDPGFFVGLSKTESERFITINANDHDTSEIRLIEVAYPERPPQVVATRREGVEYDISDFGDKLIIRTNHEAEDFAIRVMPLSALGEDTLGKSWEDFIPHEPGRLILEHYLFAEHLVLFERVDGLPRMVIYELSSGGLGAVHRVAFDEEAYSLSLIGSREYETSVVRFGYSSMTTPNQVFDYDMKTQERVLRKMQEVPSGHNPSDYVSRRVMIPSHDGEEVPVSILHHVNTPIDGSAALLIYGYGAYGISIAASFSVTMLSLVDRGFVFAIAHVRGGMERGYRWYRQGKLQNKENTFFDFIAATEGLISRGFGHPEKIAAQGGSAGGLLMGTVVNLRPELYRAIVADVPFVDVLNTMLDDTLPLTPPEWPEWGNPIVDKEAFERMLNYSPYDNVGSHSYPHMLVLAGLTDPRVTYWEPAKWVAKLRASSFAKEQTPNVLLLKTHMEAGHGGASGRFDALKETALEHAFLIHTLDMPEAQSTSPAEDTRS